MVAYSQISAWDGADRFVVVIEPGAALASQDLSIESGEKPPKMLPYPPGSREQIEEVAQVTPAPNEH